MYSNPAGSCRPWLLNSLSCAATYVGVCAARSGKFGDTLMPVRPWQLEQTCCASVTAVTFGLARSRERARSPQPVASAAPSSPRTI
jgi:hypothetical protein